MFEKVRIRDLEARANLHKDFLQTHNDNITNLRENVDTLLEDLDELTEDFCYHRDVQIALLDYLGLKIEFPECELRVVEVEDD